MNKVLKGALFGYNKTDVTYYIAELSRKTEKALDEKDDLIDDLKKEIQELKIKNDKLEDRNKMVGEAILTAQKKAAEIMESAVEKSNAKKQALEQDIKEAEMRFAKLNEEIRQLKTNIILSANKYQEELSSLISEENQ